MTERSRFLRLVGLALVGGIPSLVVVVAFGAVGLSLSVAGLVLLFAGKAAAAGMLPWWMSMDVDPRLAMIVGPFLSVAGLICLSILLLYWRFASNVVNRVIHPRTV